LQSRRGIKSRLR